METAIVMLTLALIMLLIDTFDILITDLCFCRKKVAKYKKQICLNFRLNMFLNNVFDMEIEKIYKGYTCVCEQSFSSLVFRFVFLPTYLVFKK